MLPTIQNIPCRGEFIRLRRNKMTQLLNNIRLSSLFFLLTFSSVIFAQELPAPIITPADESNLNEMGELTDGRVKEKPQIEKLKNELYRIGSIKIDKTKRLITIPGKMLSYEEGKPIEFIATMKNGYKSYESVFMLDSNAFEFNLACILIGLDSSHADPSKFHFDPEPVKGDPVAIRVSWENHGKITEYDIVEVLKIGNSDTSITPSVPSEWSYTGSMFVNGDQYLAQMDGVLIGIVHDPASVIEHRIGLLNYGFLSIDASKAPQSGQEILITIQAID